MKTISLSGKVKANKNQIQMHQVEFKDMDSGFRKRIAFSVDSCKDIKSAKDLVTAWCKYHCVVHKYNSYEFIF